MRVRRHSSYFAGECLAPTGAANCIVTSTTKLFRATFAAFATFAAIAFLWGPTLALYGAALLEVAQNDAARFAHALPFAPLPRALFWNSVSLAALTALLSVVFGFPCGVVMARASKGVRSISTVLCALPLALPPMVMASAWLELLRQPPARAMGAFAATTPALLPPVFAAAIVLALCFFPLVAFATRAALGSLSNENDDAARAFGNEWQSWWLVRGPHCACALGGAAALVAALSLWEMGAPDLLDCRTYSVQIYRDLNAADALDPAGKNALTALSALPVFALSALLFIPVARAFSSLRSAGFSPSNEQAESGTAPFVFVAFAIFLASPFAPVATFARQAQPLSVFQTAWEANREYLLNTVGLALGGATLATWCAFCLVVLWRDWRWEKWALWASVSALGIAPVLLGIALVQILNQPFFDAVYRGARSENVTFDFWLSQLARYAPVVIGFAARFLPLAILLAHEAVSRIDRTALDAARGLGATENEIDRTIVWPLVRPSLAAIWTILVALCAGELSSSVLVNSPGGQTATLPIFNQMHIGATGEVAALSLFVLAFSATAALGALCIGRNGYGRIRPYSVENK